MNALQSVLTAWSSPRVLVIGDLILDRYCHGTVDRISPEAPIQILRVTKENERLGGAGFSAHVARVLSASVTMIAVVGDDDAGVRVQSLARELEITLDVVVEAGRETSTKTRHVATSPANAQQVLRVDRESTDAVREPTEDALKQRVNLVLEHCDVVLINDYGKGLLSESLLAYVIQSARSANTPVIVDPYKATDFERYRGATAITPNRHELRRATGLPTLTTDEVGTAASSLANELDVSFVLATIDRDGMVFAESGDKRRATHMPTEPREVFDVTGAGDVVLAVLGTALAGGASPHDAAALANVAAGIEVEHAGVVPITRSDIAKRLAVMAAREGMAGLSATAHDVAVSLCQQYRDDGRIVIFTNGCFDILHAGHVHYLAKARAMGDVLVVGLNTDRSVRALKGPTRPVNAQDDRAAVLLGLAAVTHVVLFDEDDPLELIRSLKPHVLVKGMDWKDKGVVGRDVVEAYGGRVALIELLDGRSTTSTIERIGNQARPSS